MSTMRLSAVVLALISAAPMAAQEVGRSEGLAAWDRIHVVVSHPRCTNCHVGAQTEPMWNGLGYGNRAHGMAVVADETRIGAETTPCRTCHVTSGAPNDVPRAAPHIEAPWQLAPVELGWLGKSAAEICIQLRDPARNDGHDIAGLMDHLRASPFVAWGFAPGAGRSAPPGDVGALTRDVAVWGAAGSPCE